MDAHLQANPQLRYAVNGGGAQPADVSALSQDVQDCIQFFDDTIVSLEESLESDDKNPGQGNPTVTGSSHGPQASDPQPGAAFQTRPLSPNQDIIDLVRTGPDLLPGREPLFDPANPDFQSMTAAPESHLEVKGPRRDLTDGLPSEYNPPLPSGSLGSDNLASYHPPGCIPTPVLIAQKIAENQASGASNLHPSALRRRSIDSDKPPGLAPDYSLKQGPPTSAKPSRFPANISVILGNKEHQNQSLANVSINDRRAQMLANLTGTSHPLLQEDPQPAPEQKPRNSPGRSISFRDPTPDVSRMQALSKLGLNRNRAMSGDNGSLPDSRPGIRPLETTVAAPATESTLRVPEVQVAPPPSQIHIEKKPNVERTPSLRSQDERTRQPSPSPPSFSPPPYEAPPPEVGSLEFNSYGGKSIVVNPALAPRSEQPTTPTSPEPKTHSPALAQSSDNTYGGKTRVVNPASVPMARNNLPDILSSHMTKAHTLPVRVEPPPPVRVEPPPPVKVEPLPAKVEPQPAKVEPLPIELNSYGGKSRTFNPNRQSEVQTRKPPAPLPAPKPPRHHSYHGPASQHKAAQQALSPDHKKRSGSLFRPQGITVQFAGRGASDESRKEALRKLGLMKES